MLDRRAFVLAVLPVLLALPPLAAAADYTLGDLAIRAPWSPATPPLATAGAAFMEVHNGGTAADRLMAAASPVAESVELHSHEMADGVARMRRVEGGIDLPAGGNAVLAPGGLHVMLIGLVAPLVEGTTFPLRLEFERAGAIEVLVAVQRLGAMPHGGHTPRS